MAWDKWVPENYITFKISKTSVIGFFLKKENKTTVFFIRIQGYERGYRESIVIICYKQIIIISVVFFLTFVKNNGSKDDDFKI